MAKFKSVLDDYNAAIDVLEAQFKGKQALHPEFASVKLRIRINETVEGKMFLRLIWENEMPPNDYLVAVPENWTMHIWERATYRNRRIWSNTLDKI